MVVMQGLMPLVRSAQEVQEDMQREADNKKINMTLERNIQLTQVVGHVTNCFQLAVEAKRNIQTIMLDCAMQIKGKYSPEKLTSIKAGLPGGSEVFMNVTEEKCRATKAWVKDIIKETNKKPFMIENTPIPELPEDLELLIRQRIAAGIQTGEITLEQGLKVVEEKLREELLQAARDDAKEKAKKMELKIHDEHLQGNWHKALDEFISDVIDYPAGILKGPIFHKRRVLKWDTDKQGNAKPIVKEVIEKHWYRVSPFDFYPSPTAKNVQDSYMIEHHRLTRTKLYNMMGQAGYDSDAIDRILKKDEAGQLADWNYVIREGEQAEGIAPDNINNKAPDQKIDALEYWGDIKGSDLIEWGMSESKIKHPNKMYQANIWKIDNEIIKAILNPHPLGEKPYFICSFSKITGAFWGKGVPEIIKHIQDILNAIARAMVNNLAIASGPQVSKDIALMKSGENPTHITPWEIHLYNSAANEGLTANNNPVNFFQPTMNSRPLMALFEFFKKLTDEYTGIPAYTYGIADAGGAASALADYEKIWTSEGAIEMGRIRIGDRVNNSYGSYSEVMGVYPQGERDIFRMKFSNGEHIDCDIDHRWSVRTHHGRKYRTLTTGEILEKGLFRKTVNKKKNPKGYRPKWMLPKIEALQFKERDVKIDPYTMGALLGDGDARCRVTVEDKEIFDRIPYPLGKPEKRWHGKAETRSVKGIKSDYLSYGLKCKSIEKFIPEDYLYNTKEVRLELLRGIMDTDGCCTKTSETFLSSSSYKLAQDVMTLVKSLGGTSYGIGEAKAGYFKIKGRKCYRQKNYRLIFNLPGEKIFHLERKQKRVKKEKPKPYLYITGIELIGKHQATCITVDSKDALYICENFIPTHNTASGLSMLITAAGKVIKNIMIDIDNEVIAPAVQYHYDLLMLFDKDMSIKGDARIIASGATTLVAKEQQLLRLTEFANILNNPTDNMIIGIKGRAMLLRMIMEQFPVNVDDIIPSDEEIEQRRQQQMEAEMGSNREPKKTNQVNLAGEPPAGGDHALYTQRKSA